MKTTLYFAYGSNMCLRGMAARCPTAHPIGPAVLKDWRLTFRGVADIEQAAGDEVHGALWVVTKTDEQSLDRYEGVPSFYRREWVQVQTAHGNEKALVYIMNPTTLDNASLPSQGYLDSLVRGFAAFHLPRRKLEEALERTYDRVCGDKGITRFVPHGPKRMGPAGTTREQRQTFSVGQDMKLKPPKKSKPKAQPRKRKPAKPKTAQQSLVDDAMAAGMSPAALAEARLVAKEQAQMAAFRSRNAKAVA